MGPAFWISLVYFCASVVWITGSDWLLSVLFPQGFAILSMCKGWGFVLLTSLLLYVVLRREGARRDRVEAALRRTAIHDSLTGLLNRSCFLDVLGRALALSTRDGGTLGVIFLDLDGFKMVNDRLGHTCGDQLLIEASGRIVERIRSSDSAARFGGDEFVMMVRGSAKGIDALAWRLVEAMRLPFRLDGDDIRISASAGVALFPEDGLTPAQLLIAADRAMYRGKADGRDRVGQTVPRALRSQGGCQEQG